MYIKKIEIKNFKSLKHNQVDFSIPDQANPGSGLNILIGENNTGKSSLFEVLRKLGAPLIDSEEINTGAQSRGEEFSTEIQNAQGEIITYGSQFYLNPDPDYKIYVTRQDFSLSFYHVNTNRKISKKTRFTLIGNQHSGGRQVNVEEKADTYEIIQEMHRMTSEKKNEFCSIVNSFLPDISRVYVESKRRSDEALLSCKLIDGTRIDLRDMGSGIEQFIILLWTIKFSTDKILVVDEPEISLHPRAQLQLMELLIESSKDRQIFIATHSPYLFKDFINQVAGVFIFKKVDGCTTIDNLKQRSGLFPWSPSWGEINYFAYDLPSIDLHNEIYAYLQDREKKYTEIDFEVFLTTQGIPKDRSYIKKMSDGTQSVPYAMTLSTYIRNQIHHPENQFNTPFTILELRKSIDVLLALLV